MNAAEPLTPRGAPEPPYLWASAVAIRRIREAFDDTSYLDQALAVYLTLCDLANDEHGAPFVACKRKIAESSGVCLRRVTDILPRLKAIRLMDWEQNHIEGSKELSASTYTLMSCTPCPTSGTPCPSLTLLG